MGNNNRFKKMKTGLLSVGFEEKTIIGASVSMLITFAFALYNGFLGIAYSSLWHGTICIYYILLATIRTAIVAAEYKSMKNPGNDCRKRRNLVFLITSPMMLLLDLSLTVPISLMVKMEKPVALTMIPAIAMALYTTYKMTFATINLIQRKKTDNILVKELRTINFTDALLSIITLQNTLVMVSERGAGRDMLILAAITGAAALIVMIALSLTNLFSGIKAIRDEER